jgi:hypothetical protein
MHAVLKLAERAVTGAEKSSNYDRFMLGRALAEYRAGRPAEAVKWLERLAANAGGEPVDATAFAILAMSQHRRRGGDQAEAALAKARAIMAKMPDPARGQPFRDAWLDWLHAQILDREAEALLKKESESKSQQSGKKPN